MPVQGDEELLQRLREKSLTVDEYYPQFLTECIMWDSYALPDFQYNPTNHRYNHRKKGDYHALMAPDPKSVRNAFNTVLRKLLDDEEMWLLEIPRELVCTHVFDTYILRSPKGVAVAMARGLFGNLFIVNEIIEQIRLGIESKLDPASRIYLEEHFAEYVSHLLAETEVWKKTRNGFIAPDNDLSKITLMLQQLRHSTDEEFKMKIWRMTTIQQLFMILHEFGHIAQFDCKDTTGDVADGYCEDLSARPFEDDFYADRWAMWKLRYGIPGVCGENHTEIFASVARLFGMLVIISETIAEYGKYSDKTVKRINHLSDSLPVAIFNGAESLPVFLSGLPRSPVRFLLEGAIDKVFIQFDTTEKSVQDYYRSGCRAMSEEDIVRAEVLFTRGLDCVPAHLPSLVKRAMCYYQQEKIEKAEEEYAKVQKITPINESERVLYCMAVQHASVCRFDRGDTNGAIELAQQCLSLDWEDGVSTVKYNLACYYSRRSTEHGENADQSIIDKDVYNAVEYLSQAVAELPGFVNIARKEVDFKPIADTLEFISLVGVYEPEYKVK